MRSQQRQQPLPCGLKMKKSDVRFGIKEGGSTHFGLEKRFAWQKGQRDSRAMYTIPVEKAPPFSFGTSTRADWKKIIENTKDLHNPNGKEMYTVFVVYFICAENARTFLRVVPLNPRTLIAVKLVRDVP